VVNLYFILSNVFQSTLPMRGETSCRVQNQSKVHSFQSTLPMRGETPCLLSLWPFVPHFNPLSPCGERLKDKNICKKIVDFNPLSPCGERRHFQPSLSCFLYHFNPLSPCGERPVYVDGYGAGILFQSTLPMRGETHSIRS